jgi:hypothetical protein
MTLFETLSIVFGGIQTLAIIVSLFAVWRQLKQFNENMRYDAYSKHVEDYSKVSELLISHPDLNAIYYSQQPEVNQLAEKEKSFYNFVALVMGFYERLYNLRYKKQWIDEPTWKTWELWLIGQWFPLKEFDVFWRSERGWWTPDFAEYIDKKYSEYQSAAKGGANQPLKQTGPA